MNQRWDLSCELMIFSGKGQVVLRPAEDEQHQPALLQRGHERHPRQAPQHEGRPVRLRLMKGSRKSRHWRQIQISCHANVNFAHYQMPQKSSRKKHNLRSQKSLIWNCGNYEFEWAHHPSLQVWKSCNVLLSGCCNLYLCLFYAWWLLLPLGTELILKSRTVTFC